MKKKEIKKEIKKENKFKICENYFDLIFDLRQLNIYFNAFFATTFV